MDYIKLLIKGIGNLFIPLICAGLVTYGLSAIETPLFLNGYWTASAAFIAMDLYQSYLKRENDNR
jgi:hypothetical protein